MCLQHPSFFDFFFCVFGNTQPTLLRHLTTFSLGFFLFHLFRLPVDGLRFPPPVLCACHMCPREFAITPTRTTLFLHSTHFSLWTKSYAYKRPHPIQPFPILLPPLRGSFLTSSSSSNFLISLSRASSTTYTKKMLLRTVHRGGRRIGLLTQIRSFYAPEARGEVPLLNKAESLRALRVKVNITPINYASINDAYDRRMSDLFFKQQKEDTDEVREEIFMAKAAHALWMEEFAGQGVAQAYMHQHTASVDDVPQVAKKKRDDPFERMLVTWMWALGCSIVILFCFFFTMFFVTGALTTDFDKFIDKVQREDDHRTTLLGRTGGERFHEIVLGNKESAASEAADEATLRELLRQETQNGKKAGER